MNDWTDLSNSKLTQVEIGLALGHKSRSTISERIKKSASKHVFTVEELAKIRSYYLLAKTDKDKKILNTIKNVIYQRFKEMDLLSCVSKDHQGMGFIRQSVGEDGVLLLTEDSLLGDSLHSLFADALLKKWVLGITAEVESVILNQLQGWFYGRFGNFIDTLDVSLVRLDIAPIAELIGVMTKEGFKGFINIGEGFCSLEHPELQFLCDDLQVVRNMQPVWKLLASPESRALEYLMREGEQELEPSLQNYLQEQQRQFEASPQSIPEGTTVWSRLKSHSFSRLDDKAFDTLMDCIEGLDLRHK